MRHPRSSIPSLGQRRWELEQLKLPGARVEIRRGRELFFNFSISPSSFSRLYQCTLHIKAGFDYPVVVVHSPSLSDLAGDNSIPHTYTHNGKGTKLCLWWPVAKEWHPRMKLTDTYIAWTAEWLGYFEDWLATGEWAGGGRHPGEEQVQSEAKTAVTNGVED